MSKSNAAENALLALLFNQTTWTSLATSTGVTSLYIALHTSDPGEGGDQTTNEATYTSYARVAVARTAGGWTVSSGSVTNVAEILFPTCTGGSETVTHFSIGIAASSTSQILYKGALASGIAVSNNIAPRIAASALTITED